jgi:cytochrome c
MKSPVVSLAIAAAAVAGLCASAPALANAELAQKKNCMSCHTVQKKVVGPAFKDIAVKYAGQKDAVDKLTQKVLKGGSGAWGAVFMPAMKDANPPVSEAEARQLVTWILQTQ